MLKNLIKEMAGAKVTQENLASTLNVHRNTIANRLNGEGKFSIEDAIQIQKTYFPTLGLGYLFEETDSEITQEILSECQRLR